MKEKNMTALISCFVKSYHYKNYKCRIFSDSYADNILKENEYDQKKATYIKCDFTTDEWINNIINSDYDKNKISFNSLLGISYYLTYDEFTYLLPLCVDKETTDMVIDCINQSRKGKMN